MIGRGEYRRVELGGREVGLERRVSGGGGAILRGVGGGHAREPVQALGAERGRPRYAGRGQEPPGQDRGAGQGVRAAGCDTGGGDGRAIFQALLREGVIVRAMDGYGLPGWVRISVGTPEQNRRCTEALARVISRTRPASTPAFLLRKLASLFTLLQT